MIAGHIAPDPLPAFAFLFLWPALVGPSLFSAWVTVFSWEIVPIEFDPIDDVPASCCLTIAHVLVLSAEQEEQTEDP